MLQFETHDRWPSTIQLIRDAAAVEKIPFSHFLIDEDGGVPIPQQILRRRIPREASAVFTCEPEAESDSW